MLKFFVFMALVIVITGCSSGHHGVFLRPDFVPKPQAKVEVRNVVNKTEEMEVNVSKLFKDELRDTLADEDLLWVEGRDDVKLVIDVNIMKYNKRWGVTQLVVYCNIIDPATNKKVGFINVQEVEGGLLTGWKKVFKQAARQVVESLRQKMEYQN